MKKDRSARAEAFRTFRAKLNSFLDHQGFLIVVSACVSIIIGTAVWTGRQETTCPAPTPPVDLGRSAAQLMQQSLQDAATPAPTPSPTPSPFKAPLSRVVVLQPFDDSRLTASGVTGIWQVHDAADLAAEAGEKVLAMADGTVLAVTEKTASGVSILIDHGSGVQATYAGLSLSAALQDGDTVQQGQTIGFAGAGPLDENDMEPHLHLRVTRSGKAIDPVLLWQ